MLLVLLLGSITAEVQLSATILEGGEQVCLAGEQLKTARAVGLQLSLLVFSGHCRSTLVSVSF